MYFIVHCTRYTVHCTLYTRDCTLYTVHCTLYTVHCTPGTVHYTLCTLNHEPLYTIHCIVFCTPPTSTYIALQNIINKSFLQVKLVNTLSLHVLGFFVAKFKQDPETCCNKLLSNLVRLKDNFIRSRPKIFLADFGAITSLIQKLRHIFTTR